MKFTDLNLNGSSVIAATNRSPLTLYVFFSDSWKKKSGKWRCDLHQFKKARSQRNGFEKFSSCHYPENEAEYRWVEASSFTEGLDKRHVPQCERGFTLCVSSWGSEWFPPPTHQYLAHHLSMSSIMEMPEKPSAVQSHTPARRAHWSSVRRGFR